MAESVVETLSPELYKEKIIYFTQAEKLAAESPDKLLKKIRFIVYRSYAYFTLLLAGSVLLGLFFVASLYYVHNAYVVYAAIAAFSVAYTVIKGLFFRVPDPNAKDFLLDLKTVPVFEKMLDKLSGSWTVKIDKVFVNSAPNAFAYQSARFGIFGVHRNIITLGLPVLLYLSRSELEAVLAHELGHLSNNDSKATGFINGVRVGWMRMLGSIDRTKARASLITWYLKREWPRLDAYTFVYSRSQETSADTFAASNGGKVVWPASLLKMHIVHFRNEEFWEQYSAKIRAAAKVPEDVYDEMREFFRTPIKKEKLEEWLQDIAFTYTRAHDTHPAFAERLKAQGVDTSTKFLSHLLEQSVEAPALLTVFPEAQEKLIAHFNAAAKTGLAANWENIRARQKEVDEGIAALPTLAISDAKFWQSVGMKAERDGALSVQEYIEKVLAHDAEDVTALFIKARIHLEKGEEDGRTLMQKLISENKIAVSEAYPYIYKYLMKQGRQGEARELDKEIQREHKKVSDAGEENATLSEKDVLHPPELPEQVKAAIVAAGKKHKSIREIRVARRELKNAPHRKNYVAAVYLNTFRVYGPSHSRTLVGELAKEILFDGMIFTAEGKYSSYAWKVKEVQGSGIYES